MGLPVFLCREAKAEPQEEQMKKQVIFVLIAALALLVGTSVAQSPAGPGSHFEMFEGHGLEMMATALDLSSQQQASIKSITEQAHLKMAPLMQEVGDVHKQIQAAAFSENFDPASVRAIIESHKASLEDLVVNMAQTESDVLKVLT